MKCLVVTWCSCQVSLKYVNSSEVITVATDRHVMTHISPRWSRLKVSETPDLYFVTELLTVQKISLQWPHEYFRFYLDTPQVINSWSAGRDRYSYLLSARVQFWQLLSHAWCKNIYIVSQNKLSMSPVFDSCSKNCSA